MSGKGVTIDRESVFVALFDAYYAKVLVYTRRRLGPDGCEEAVADTFMSAWMHLDQAPADPLIWLYGIARGAVANHRRRLLRSARLNERARTLGVSPRSTEVAEALIWEDTFGAAVAQLSEADREVLRLVHWEELSNADGAAVLGCSTVASSWHGGTDPQDHHTSLDTHTLSSSVVCAGKSRDQDAIQHNRPQAVRSANPGCAAAGRAPAKSDWVGTICDRVSVVSKLSRGPRVAVVVVWAAVLTLVGMYVASGWSIFGYVESVTLPRRVGYTPLSIHPVDPSRFGLTALECFFVWLALVGVWLLGAVLILGTSRQSDQTTAEPSNSPAP
ncbi:MAG: RNA polymerase sigma factor [Acidimicrobiales bacterium]